MDSYSRLESVSPPTPPVVRLFVTLTLAEAIAVATLTPDTTDPAALRAFAKIRSALEARA